MNIINKIEKPKEIFCFDWILRIFSLIFFAGFSFLAYLALKGNGNAIILAVIFFIAVAFYLSSHLKFIFNKESIINRLAALNFFFKTIKWSDVEIINNQRFLFIRYYYILPKNSSWIRTTGILITNTMTNYKKVLKEAIFRTNPNTIVDKSILQKIGLAEIDIGKHYGEK